MPEEFDACFARAQAVTVYWCPVIKRPDWPAQWSEITAPDDNAQPNGLGEFAPDDVDDAIRQLAGRSMEQDELEAVTFLLKHWFRDPQPVRVAFVNDRFPEWAKHMVGGTTLISFGLWEESQNWFTIIEAESPLMGNRWYPELNVCVTYPLSQAGHGLTSDTLRTVLYEFATRMWQCSIFLTLREQNGMEIVWLYRPETGGQFTHAGAMISWRLEGTSNTSWHQQIIHMCNTLNDGYCGHEHIKQLIDGDMQAVANGAGGLGATLVPDADHVLKISVCGRARFLFAPFFWSKNYRPEDVAVWKIFTTLFDWPWPHPGP
jgi:hypothetical protein